MPLKALWGALLSILDAASQLLARCIPVRFGGEWHHYSRTANESFSGASHWHADHGRWPWVATAIDRVFLILSLGRDEDHCRTSRINDRLRAAGLLRSLPPKEEP